ncbi:MAG: bifunctional nuclease family protein [Candidatus Aenigmarchaeota archaeon]|nr:bifunctional nuclease family protein [Candidatus Aenigmarchaeota archaeon]
MPRKKPEKKYKFLSGILMVIVALLSLFIILPKFFPEELPLLAFPGLSTLGFERVNNVDVRIIGNEGLVILSASCYELTGIIEPTQAISIQNALQNITTERPNAHDLARDVFNTLDIKMLMVKITELRDSAYFAKILLRQKNTFLNFDVRPSDGIAIALRVGAPIYIDKGLLERQGKYIC